MLEYWNIPAARGFNFETAAVCLKNEIRNSSRLENLVSFFSFFLNLLFFGLGLPGLFFKQQIHKFVSQWGRFDIFITRAASVNYPNVQHQSRECGFDAARRACHNLNSIIDPSIRSIVDPNVQHQSRKAALMLPGARDTTYILTSIPA